MKLRNKQTGEIVDYNPTLERWNGPSKEIKHYVSLAELNEEWEDVPEKPKKYYYINDIGAVQREDVGKFVVGEMARKQIGNYFLSREDAEKAVERLRAWTRLKDRGFRFNSCKIEMSEIIVPEITITAFIDTEEPETLNLVNLLFGGEE